jgi:hypothetical protein
MSQFANALSLIAQGWYVIESDGRTMTIQAPQGWDEAIDLTFDTMPSPALHEEAREFVAFLRHQAEGYRTEGMGEIGKIYDQRADVVLALLDRMAVATPPTAGGWKPDREAVARIIDPKAWENRDEWLAGPYAKALRAEAGHEVRSSLAKADRLLSLISGAK